MKQHEKFLSQENFFQSDSNSLIGILFFLFIFLIHFFFSFDFFPQTTNIFLHGPFFPKITLLRGEKFDLNHIDTLSLEVLPGIGPNLAKRIIDYRNEHGFFYAIEDLRFVSGLGEKKVEIMRPFLVVREPKQ